MSGSLYNEEMYSNRLSTIVCEHRTAIVELVASYSGRTLVFDRRTFHVLRSTCSWRATTYVGKPSALGQKPGTKLHSWLQPSDDVGNILKTNTTMYYSPAVAEMSQNGESGNNTEHRFVTGKPPIGTHAYWAWACPLWVGWNVYPAKAGGINRHVAWYTSPYPWSCSVRWCLAEGLACGDQHLTSLCDDDDAVTCSVLANT